MRKKCDPTVFIITAFLLLFLPTLVGCGDDADDARKIGTLTAGLQQVMSDLDAASAQIRAAGDGSAAANAKINILETAFDNMKLQLAALSNNGNMSTEHLAIILGKLQGLSSQASDIDRAVMSLNRLIEGVDKAAGSNPTHSNADIDKVVNYISKISELEAQSLVLTNFLEDGMDEVRRKLETQIRADFKGNLDTLEIYIKKKTEASLIQIKDDTEVLIDQLQTTRSALLKSITQSEKEISELSQTISLLQAKVTEAEGKHVLGREQITAIIETTVDQALKDHDINLELMQEVAGKIAEINPLLVTLNEAFKKVGTMITNITLVKPSSIRVAELAFSTKIKSSYYTGRPDFGANNLMQTGYERFPPYPYAASLFFKYGMSESDYYLSPVSKTDAELVLQVKPENARFEKNMIRLVDAQRNEDINGFIEITSVTPYKNTITRTDNTGLYTVSFKLKSIEMSEALKAKVLYDPGYGYDPQSFLNNGIGVNRGTNQRFFALAAKTAGITDPTNAADRYVVSDFGIIITNRSKHIPALDAIDTLGYFPFPRSLNFYISSDGKRKSDQEIKTPLISRSELTWTGSYTKRNLDNPFNESLNLVNYEQNYEKKFSVDPEDGKRRSLAPFDIPVNGSFQVDLYSPFQDGSFSDIGNAYGYYITLEESKIPVVIADFEGIGKMYTIKQTATVKRINRLLPGEVNFRIIAINHDGTLVDPDGRAFVINYK